MHTIVFDFDGIFTDNKVIVSETGVEHVTCSREDGLGIDILRRLAKIEGLDLQMLILSTERNKVVNARANKLGINCIHGVNNKLRALNSHLRANGKNINGVIYLGNDINDIEVMMHVGLSYAPADAHPLVRQVATHVLKKKGGDGVVREFVEQLTEFKNWSIQDVISVYSGNVQSSA